MAPEAGRTARFAPSGPLRGELGLPGDKSISHRAALLAAMGDSEVVISNYLDAGDTRATLAAMSALGAVLRDPSGDRELDLATPGLPEEIGVAGVGLFGPRPAEIDVGNAGTLIRLLPGWLAGQAPGAHWRLDGDESIRRRPMARIAEPLRRMGACINCGEGDRAPLAIEGASLKGIEYELPVASAQVKSCILLAGLVAEGATTVIEPEPSRDHTERMLAACGAEVTVAGTAITIHGAGAIEPPASFEVPADLSSAAFFAVGATLVEGSDIVLRRVGMNPTRTAFLDVLERMGAAIERSGEETVGGEVIADLRVRSASLAGTEVGGREIPGAIDELPILALAAACAEGRTVVRDAAELRRKESDRIEAVAAALEAIGARIEATDDGWVIDGAGTAAGLRGGAIDSRGDHRIAMLGAVAGVAVPGGVEVAGMEAAAVSYPEFERDLSRLRGLPASSQEPRSPAR